jgi:hypothetical protein
MARKSTGTAITTTETAQASGALTLPNGIKQKRAVIVPTLNLKVGEPRVLLFVDEMRVSTYVDPDPKKAKEKPATVAMVGDVQTGEQFLLLVPSVLESSLKETYPDNGYKGLTFYVEKLPKRPSKRYFDFKCVEVEVDADAMKAAA